MILNGDVNVRKQACLILTGGRLGQKLCRQVIRNDDGNVRKQTYLILTCGRMRVRGKLAPRDDIN